VVVIPVPVTATLRKRSLDGGHAVSRHGNDLRVAPQRAPVISFLSARDGCRHLQVIANRFNARHGNIDGDSATNALTRPVDWKIPNAYTAVRTAQDSGVPVAMDDSPIRAPWRRWREPPAASPWPGQEGQPRVQPLRPAGLPDAAGT